MFHSLSTLTLLFVLSYGSVGFASERPHIVLVMADDQGWGETGYNGHPRLKTPNLDALAAEGVLFDRFYAGGPVCSPTRASVLTGRNHNRCGVPSHGHALRRQEITIAQMLQQAGYRTGHFGKWHLNGLRGPGVPILADDSHHPGNFGFDHWLSVTNFFDRNPILGREGAFEEFRGDSSEIVIREALKFLGAAVHDDVPSFSVVWYGTPHDPFFASEADASEFNDLDARSQQHYGELVALDRSIGAMREGVKDLGIADDTLIWYCSDNGGLGKITPGTVGDLRGLKGTLYEGGLRVPGIVHWPARFTSRRVEKHPAGAVDILPTLADLLDLKVDASRPIDGISLVPVLDGQSSLRPQPMCFHYQGNTAVIDNDMKLIKFVSRKGTERYELFDLGNDRSEESDLADMTTAAKARLISVMDAFETSMKLSIEGKDYPEGQVASGEPEPSFWMTHPAYQPFLDSFRVRPEYKKRLK
ncbi:MAG: sulfatase-like hydrolase/transferase [Aureliella sp.]